MDKMVKQYTNELVSVIMPSFNTGRFITAAVQSVLRQTHTNWELIIVDDCSTDNTNQVLKELSDSRIIYLRNEARVGAAASRNRALTIARGKWIAFLDSDDYWKPEKLMRQISFMRENGYHFTYTKYSLVNEESQELGTSVSGPNIITIRGMYNYCWPGCLTVMYNAEAVGRLQVPDLKKHNDYAMWLRVIQQTKTCYLLDEDLARYRRRKGSISRSKYIELTKHHYLLFRIGERKTRAIALAFTLRNLVFGFIKKVKYVHRCLND